MSDQDAEPRLDGQRVWLVTDGTAETEGWAEPLATALRDGGAASVDVLGVSGVLTLTARGLLEQGADVLARTLRFTRRGEPDTDAAAAVRHGRPDVVIADNPTVLRTLEVVRDTTRVGSVHIGLVPHYEPLESWHGARADAFIAPDTEQLAALRRPNMSEAALQVAGPPLPPGFDRELDRSALREEFGFGDDATVVLVDAVGLDGPLLDRIVFQLSVVRGGVVPVFYYGHDRNAADVLRHAAATHALEARMFGHVDALEEFVVVADVMIVGPECPRVAAYLAQHRPLLAVDPAASTTVPARTGAMVVLADVMTLGEIVGRIVTGGVAQEHVDAARELGRPQGTADVAAAVAAIWTSRATLVDVTPRAPVSPSTPAPAPRGRAGRFEDIGAGADTAQQLTPLSRAAAKEQLAALIVEERRVEADVTALARERDRWLQRLELAREAADDELIGVAGDRAEELNAQIRTLNERLASIESQKDLVRRRAAIGRPSAPEAKRGGTADPYEDRFRDLERKGDIDRLRRRAEGGDEDA